MEKTPLLLDPKENPLLIRIFQIIFGIVCIAVAVFWIVFNLQSLKADRNLWLTTILLSGFGIYLIFTGLGKTKKYISITSQEIILKKNPVLPKVVLQASQIEKIESYPMNINFHISGRRKIALRFGTNYPEIIDPVKKELIDFARMNNISFEIKY